MPYNKAEPREVDAMRTVKEVSELTGVSVRTLHHYDGIGLLKPTATTDAGYRMYDDAALEKLYTILLFRELEFPLKDIKAIMDSPRFDPSEALEQQIQLLEKQYKHIGRLIALACEIQRRGKEAMGFEAFDKTEIEQYKQEARERWGSTEAYQEYMHRQLRKTKQENEKDGEVLTGALRAIAELRPLMPEAAQVQQKVQELQAVFSARFYSCTKEILLSLGEMYVTDERFTRNIDRDLGEGAARFIRDAIRVYCKKA